MQATMMEPTKENSRDVHHAKLPETVTSKAAPTSTALASDLEDTVRARPKTFVRPTLPDDLLLHPVITSNSLKSDIFITSPFHIAGGAVVGKLNLSILGQEDTDFRISRVAVDVVGIEELSWAHRRMFLALAVEFIDDTHPPPSQLLREKQTSSPFWKVKPGEGVFPFVVELPLDVGPGTFNSAGARIRYVIYGTILFKMGNSKFLARCCRDIAVTPSINELRKLQLDFSHEIKVYEERQFLPARDGFLKLTASLSRPYWFSGGSAFIDVVINNGSPFNIGKIRVKLVRYINAYKNSRLSDGEIASTGYPRHPSWTERKTVARSELNSGSRWTGLTANHEDSVTCEIEIPKGQLTVSLGSLFDVQYFLHITTCPKFDPHRKVKAVLPIKVLHSYSVQEALMTSIDNYGSISGSIVMQRSLPARTSTVSGPRRRYTESDLSYLEPKPIDDVNEETSHVTAGSSTQPVVGLGQLGERKSGQNHYTSLSRPRTGNSRFHRVGLYLSPIRNYINRTGISSLNRRAL